MSPAKHIGKGPGVKFAEKRPLRELSGARGVGVNPESTTEHFQAGTMRVAEVAHLGRRSGDQFVDKPCENLCEVSPGSQEPVPALLGRIWAASGPGPTS
jgi:hypothetical protein